MDHEEKITYIRLVFQGSALFDGRSDCNRYDVKESARKYATLCQQALEQTYPGAKVEVFDTDVSGALSGSVKTQVNDRSDSYEAEAVEQLCDEVYNKFEWEVPRQWLNISGAHQRFKVPVAIICWACREGLTAEAEKSSGHWEFPLDTFNEFLDNKVLVNCRGVVGIRIANDGTRSFECYSEDILDIRAVDFPPGVQALLIVTPNCFGALPLFSAENSSLLISKHTEQVDLLFEHFGGETSWASVWTYDAYAKAVVTQAERHGVGGDYDNGTFVIKLTFDSLHLHTTLRALIVQAVSILGEIVRDAELSLLGAPVWEDVYEKDESSFCEKVLSPLLRKMGFMSVRYIHGQKEFGKDFVFSELTRFGELRHYGLQAKAGNISGNVNSELKEILGQIEDAFGIPYEEVGEPTPRYISTFIVAISGHFTENAKEKIRNMMPRGVIGSVYFWDKEKILSLIAKYCR